MNTRYELITYIPEGEFYLCQFAVDGRVTDPFYVFKGHRTQFQTDRAWMDYLCRQADSMVELGYQGPQGASRVN